MPKKDNVRFLNQHFKKALILGHPDPSLDDYLRDQDIEPDRRQTRDTERVIEILEEGRHDLLYKRSSFEVDRRVLQASDNLAAIMLCCIGDDSVDKQACAEEGVLCMNDPISNGWSVVELVTGEMICLARRVFEATRNTAQSVWTKNNTHRYELRDKSLSIIGLGHIGKEVATVAEQSFDMDIHFYDNSEVAEEVGTTLGWNACGSIGEAFRKGDFVTVHVSAEDRYGNSNEGLLNYEEHFSQLGADRGENSPRIFLNAARGFLFDPEDLIRAVEEGQIRHAATDVYPQEPVDDEDWTNPYADVENIENTPHIGAATQEAQPRIAKHKATTTRLLNRYGTARNTVFGTGETVALQAEDPSYVLTVMHSDDRGTKKAVDDCIYEAGLSNLQSAHRDFPRYGFAYDVNALDKPLSETQLEHLIESARSITGKENAIRAIRMIDVSEGPAE